MKTDATDRASLSRDGFAIARDVAGASLVRALRVECPAVPQAGLRDLLGVAPAFVSLAQLPGVREWVAAALGKPGFVARAILFDKTPGANWALGFHQDVVIAVAGRADVPGFGPWSVKTGIDHVRPPASVLEGMITVRIHLDDCGPENGPLVVIPGSHTHGFLSDEQIAAAIEVGPVVDCTCRAGDAVLMRPLLLHGSRKSAAVSHRRVAHLEFAADPLPPPLRWREASSARAE
jgi:ectoine hydroxylase-related dioxygenase (phytanoyl-CoA dioxygenase family)